MPHGDREEIGTMRADLIPNGIPLPIGPFGEGKGYQQ